MTPKLELPVWDCMVLVGMAISESHSTESIEEPSCFSFYKYLEEALLHSQFRYFYGKFLGAPSGEKRKYLFDLVFS